MRQLSRIFGAIFTVCAVTACGLVAQQGAKGQTVPPPATPEQKATAAPSNPDSAVLADFNARLDRYITLQRALLKEAPLKETSNPAEITVRQDLLASKLRNIRKEAKQGDIFPPQVAALFKRLMGCGHNPHVNAYRLCASYPIEGPFRQDAQQARLQFKGHIADFV